MTNTLKIQKRITLLSLIVIVVSIALWLAWIVVADTVIEAAFNGESLPLVNKYVSIHKSIDPANRTLEYFLTNGKPVVPRLLGLIIAGNILFLIGLRYGRSLLKNFFSEPTHPVNLAIFRIVLFAAIIGYLDVAQVVQFSGFPPDLRVAPFGLGWILNSIPINPLWARATSYAFILACAAGCLGFFSRTSALLATVLGMYVLGIPQFFGKIDHYHHLLWFTALLAASPCGDVLSIDALIGARRKGISEPLQPSTVYALPLRFVMLLMGIIYFFAGAWKFIIGGFGWATSDNMKYILYAQWFRLDWTPAFRIDHYPLLYISAGIGVMIFELTFLFLLFIPRVRNYAAVAGILFHLAIFIFARINFWTLGLCYIVFIDFEPLYRRWKATPPAPTEGILFNRQPKFVNRKSSTIVVGGLLLSMNIICGIALIDSWPFAVYPTFASVEEKYLQSLTLSIVNHDGTTDEIIPYKDRLFQTTLHPSRLIGLFTQVLWTQDSAEMKRRGTALVQVLAEKDPRLRQATTILLYKDICSVVPEEQKNNPIRREFLLRVQQ